MRLLYDDLDGGGGDDVDDDDVDAGGISRQKFDNLPLSEKTTTLIRNDDVSILYGQQSYNH